MPGGHLDDGEHGVETVEHTLDRHADDRQRGACGNHARQCGSHAGTRNDDFDAALFGTFGETLHGIRCAVGRQCVDLERYLHIVEELTCFSMKWADRSYCP